MDSVFALGAMSLGSGKAKLGGAAFGAVTFVVP